MLGESLFPFIIAASLVSVFSLKYSACALYKRRAESSGKDVYILLYGFICFKQLLKQHLRDLRCMYLKRVELLVSASFATSLNGNIGTHTSKYYLQPYSRFTGFNPWMACESCVFAGAETPFFPRFISRFGTSTSTLYFVRSMCFDVTQAEDELVSKNERIEEVR